MKTTISSDVHSAKAYLERAANDLDAEKSIGAIPDILRALLMFDETYKEWCTRYNSVDEAIDTWENGTSMEFYIESSDWHDVSVALREWKAANPNWAELLNVDTEGLIDMNDREALQQLCDDG